jgi:hypothetical protein
LIVDNLIHIQTFDNLVGRFRVRPNFLNHCDFSHDGHPTVTIGEIAIDGANEENLSLVHPLFFVLDLDDLFDLLVDNETGQGDLELDLGSDGSRTELDDGTFDVPRRRVLVGLCVEDIQPLMQKKHNQFQTN